MHIPRPIAIALALLVGCALAPSPRAQEPAHDMHEHGAAKPVPPKPTPTAGDQHADHGTPAQPATAPPSAMSHEPGGEPAMAMGSRPLDLPMQRDASGTAWQPDATPMAAIHRMFGDWTFMLHGNMFAGYDWQGTDRGDENFTSVNWLMLMASRPLGGGELELRGMLSAEPLTVGDDGYPLLLQSGETADGEPLHDRQHAHDLFMELALRYSHAIGSDVAFDVYAAPAGEPALGPVAFPHRASAMSDPLAPLGHHWEDATHISFGVFTAGLFGRKWKVEGSWFNGREPDEERTDFDWRSLDSWSARVSVNPTERVSFQVSTGLLESPEALEPDVSVQRTTASVSVTGSQSSDRPWALTAAWGRNDPDEGPSTDAFLVEGDFPLGEHETVFARAELVTKTGHDLVLGPGLDDETFDIASLVVGYSHDFDAWGKWTPSVGARVSANFFDDDLESFYGDDVGYGAMVFFRIRPSAMKHGPIEQHESMPGMH